MAMQRLVTALAVLVISSSFHIARAASEEWVEVASDNETVHYVNETSMQREGSVVRVRKRAVYRQPQPMGELPGTPLIRESVGVVEDDCERHIHRVVSIQLISTDDKIIWSSGDMKRVWETVESGTTGRATLEWVCAKTASK